MVESVIKREQVKDGSLPPSEQVVEVLEIYLEGLLVGGVCGLLTGIIALTSFTLSSVILSPIILLLYTVVGGLLLGTRISEHDAQNPEIDYNREVASDSFEYGNHQINATVEIAHESKKTVSEEYNEGLLDVDIDTDGSHYFRIVTVEAVNPDTDEIEVSNTTVVPVDHSLTDEGDTSDNLVKQTQVTAQTVFDELDYVYKHTVNMDSETDTALELMSESISWVETDSNTLMNSDENKIKNG